MKIEEMIEVLEAYREGKEIEAKPRSSFTNFEFVTTEKPGWDFFSFEYRIKPKPAPPEYWSKEEHIPVGALIRVIDYPKQVHLILNNFEGHAGVWGPQSFIKIYKFHLHLYEHSTDNGKTWHPCTVQTAA